MGGGERGRGCEGGERERARGRRERGQEGGEREGEGKGVREERESERNRKGGSRTEENGRGRRGRVRRELLWKRRDQHRKGGRMGKEGIKSCIKNSPNNCYVNNQIYKPHINTNTH